MVRSAYPATVLEVLDDEIVYSDELLCVLRIFAASNPWKGSPRIRQRKYRQINHLMAIACRIDKPLLVFDRLDGDSSGASDFITRVHRIVIVGKLSVVTYLLEFAHALGFDEQEACRWSINLFRKCFPRQYSRLIHVGHTLVRPQDISATLAKEGVR